MSTYKRVTPIFINPYLNIWNPKANLTIMTYGIFQKHHIEPSLLLIRTQHDSHQSVSLGTCVLNSPYDQKCHTSFSLIRTCEPNPMDYPFYFELNEESLEALYRGEALTVELDISSESGDTTAVISSVTTEPADTC